MSSACINVEFLTGTTIEAAISEARTLAANLGLAYVVFDFNGVEVRVKPSGDDKDLIDQFNDAMTATDKYCRYAIG